MTNDKAFSIALLGGVRSKDVGPTRTHIAAVGGMDLDLRDRTFAAETVITKVSLVGGVSVVVPPDVRVEVQGFTLIGGKDIERPADLQPGAPVLKIRAFGLFVGVKVRVMR
jgi:hypothetical protein